MGCHFLLQGDSGNLYRGGALWVLRVHVMSDFVFVGGKIGRQENILDVTQSPGLTFPSLFTASITLSSGRSVPERQSGKNVLGSWWESQGHCGIFLSCDPSTPVSFPFSTKP